MCLIWGWGAGNDSNAYREELLQSGKGKSSINRLLLAMRNIASEAAGNGLVPPALACGAE
jgi:hypothetical protein